MIIEGKDFRRLWCGWLGAGND